jgi:hypothetical protein
MMMVKKAKPVENAYVPWSVLPFEGFLWMRFQYSHDGLEPWKWPKVMEYDGKKYEWMSFDSDHMYINYKELKTEPARGVK